MAIRNISDRLGKQLDELSCRIGKSLNTLVHKTLPDALDVKGRPERLKGYATWSEADAREFDDAVRAQRHVDEVLWR